MKPKCRIVGKCTFRNAKDECLVINDCNFKRNICSFRKTVEQYRNEMQKFPESGELGRVCNSYIRQGERND